MHQLLINREIYTEVIQKHIPLTRNHLWVITADIKDMYVEGGRGRYQPFLALLAELIKKGVSVRLIHAKEPGPRFREDFDQFDELIDNELFERILCPRVHTKAIIIDSKLAFIGSPNLTGAGMGAKHDDKRNFEAGFLFDDAAEIKKIMDWVDKLYLGDFCQNCRRRDHCPDPIADNL